MSAYLKRLNIADVDDTGENIGAYTKRVHIVEMVDADGRPWEPVPGPDPFDELVVQTDTHWANLNDYTIGSEIFAYPAKFLGGDPENNTYRYRWQYKEYGEDSWTSTSWTSYNNNTIEVSFVIPQSVPGGQVRLMSQARDDSTDPVTQVNSFASAQGINTTLGTLTPFIDTEPYPEETPVEIPEADTSSFLNVVASGNSPRIQWSWEVRMGTARLTDMDNGGCMVIFSNSGLVHIQVNAVDPGATDNTAASFRYEFFVS